MADRQPRNPAQGTSIRELWRWLLLGPIAFLILFGCGQLALMEKVYPAAPDIRSKLRADYCRWPVVIIPAINPAIIEDIRRDENLNPAVSVRPFWPTADQPGVPPHPTLIAQHPTATPLPSTSTPSLINTPTHTPQPTRTVMPYSTRTASWTPAATSWPTATDTPWPTATSQPPRTATFTKTATPVTPVSATPTPTPSPVATDTSTPTITPSATASRTPTSTPTFTLTPTPSSTSTPTAIPTATSTPTNTATSTPSPTSTPQACVGYIPPNEPNIGPPNGAFAEVQCNSYLDVDLGSQTITSHSGYDFVYYEHAGCTGICLDWARVEVCDAACSNWIPVFNWGDDVPDDNTNVAAFAAGGEIDDEDIPAAVLRNGTGITIDVDASGFPPIPPGGYRYIRIWSPLNWPNNDGAEVDSIEVLP